MGKSKERVFSPSERTAVAPQTLQGAVEEIIAGYRGRMSKADAKEHSQQILLAAADLMLAANTGLLSPDCLLAVTPTEVIEAITPLLAGEPAEEHLDALCALQHHVASLERRSHSAGQVIQTLVSFRRLYSCRNFSYTWLADRLRSGGQAA